jgi:hypothetical protein
MSVWNEQNWNYRSWARRARPRIGLAAKKSLLEHRPVKIEEISFNSNI